MMDDFEKELRDGFLEEALQLITDAEQCFLTLESSPGDKEILEKIFRLAHNLKGSAKAVGFQELSSFTHELESYLIKIREGKAPVDSDAINLLLRCNDYLMKSVTALKADAGAAIADPSLKGEIT